MTESGDEADIPHDRAAPSPSAMLESLRGIGYTTATAIADLIDNSITAGASRVRVDFLWRGADSALRITDNGRGMDREALIQAMRPAGKHPLSAREANDLGRFGLGLKTASLSQGRLLAVASKTEGGEIEARYWDLGHLERVDDWHLLKGIPEQLRDDARILEGLPSGTVVMVTQLDRLLGAPLSGTATDRSSFQALARNVEKHLSMTFHRYLEGAQPRLTITFNGEDKAAEIPAWDPFLSDHAATTATPLEVIAHSGGEIQVKGFVLPHRDRLNSVELERAEGPAGWQAHEGFFVYRGERLLVAGGWLGLGAGRGWSQNGIHRLARIKLDLPTSGDHDWKVDIRKSSAVPPHSLRARLQALADTVRRDAREIFAHRAGTGSRQQREKVIRAWNAVNTSKGIIYKVDRTHPTVKHALESVGSSRRLIEEMLAVIEETVPVQRIWIEVSEAADEATVPVAAKLSMEVRAALETNYTHMRRDLGLSADQARARLLLLEPFSAYPDDIHALPEDI